jgi:hypothetical protein
MPNLDKETGEWTSSQYDSDRITQDRSTRGNAVSTCRCFSFPQVPRTPCAECQGWWTVNPSCHFGAAMNYHATRQSNRFMSDSCPAGPPKHINNKISSTRMVAKKPLILRKQSYLEVASTNRECPRIVVEGSYERVFGRVPWFRYQRFREAEGDLG